MTTKPKVGEARARGRLTQPNSGRKAGTPNKVTTEFRETVQRLLDDNRENVSLWVRQIAEGAPEVRQGKRVIFPARAPDPSGALLRLSMLADYAAPKLSRQEQVGDGGGPLTVVIRKET